MRFVHPLPLGVALLLLLVWVERQGKHEVQTRKILQAIVFGRP